MRKKVIIFLAGAIVCLVVGWYWLNKPRQSVQFTPTDIEITAALLYEDYSNNEAEADKLYLNKVIEVKGIVDDIAGSGDDVILTLGSQPSGGGISCRFSPGKEMAGKEAAKGKEVTVKGKCTGFNIDVNLADCIIISK